MKYNQDNHLQDYRIYKAWDWSRNYLRYLGVVHIIGIELQLSHLPGGPVHIAAYGRQGFGVLELYVVVLVEPLFSHHQFVGLSEPHVPVVLPHPALSGSTGLSNVHLAALRLHTASTVSAATCTPDRPVNPLGPGWRSTTSRLPVLCLFSVLQFTIPQFLHLFFFYTLTLVSPTPVPPFLFFFFFHFYSAVSHFCTCFHFFLIHVLVATSRSSNLTGSFTVPQNQSPPTHSHS